jgi:DNA-binding NarL/FixJ family response regulator
MTQVDTVRVLVIVEDEPDMRMMIRSILLTDSRIEIVGEAASAAEAIEVARSMDPGLVILDHSIEGDIMGLEAAPLIKAVAPNAKILLFSAFDLKKEADAEPAIDAFLGKSDVSLLLKTVQWMLHLPNGGSGPRPSR